MASANMEKLGRAQVGILVILRVAVGWHLMYEGVVKLLEPRWTSAPFLAESKWILGGLFRWIAQTPPLLAAVDFLNMWGLTLIGLGLMLGLMTRAAAICGAVLLGLYYVANPPFIGYVSGMPTEGNYLWVDKNLIEILALAVLALLPTGHLFGLDRLVQAWRSGMAESWERPQRTVPLPATAGENPSQSLMVRRELVKSLATAPFLGGFVFGVMKKRGWESFEERRLLELGQVDTVSSATMKSFQFSSLKDLKGTMSYGKIGDLRLSRIFLGGNLIGGWAHARDLIYVSKLVKSYHTDEKVFDTFRLAELCGINTILTNPVLARVINEYWRKRGGKIQFISDCAYQNDVFKGIRMSVEGGAHACYVQGGIADQMVADGKVDQIGKALEYIREFGLPAGIGAHKLETVQECVRVGLKPDFWVKTLHHCNYWSATGREEHDNIWCTNPEETIAFMQDRPEPWIAFKILAAGAIEPQEGFRYAFQNGADFICVGMYDFQIVDDVNLACAILSEQLPRTRMWMA
jgi:uncharacterized membrane protein YphA (DoxX/SURF4 family)